MAILDLDDAREVLGDLPASKNDQLNKLLDAVAEVVEYLAGPVDPREVTETVDGGESAVVLRNGNVLDVLSVTVNGTAVAADTGYTFDAGPGIVYPGTDYSGGRFTCGSRSVVITYLTGRNPIPQNIVEAAKEQLRFLWQLGQQANRPGFGDDSSAETEFSPSGYPIYDRVSSLLGGYRRPRNYVFT